MDTRLTMTKRSAPATSTPWWKAPRITARIPNRNKATANEPTVRLVRIFFRNRFAIIRWKYFIGSVPGVPRPPARLYPGARSCRHAPLREDHELQGAPSYLVPGPGWRSDP